MVCFYLVLFTFNQAVKYIIYLISPISAGPPRKCGARLRQIRPIGPKAGPACKVVTKSARPKHQLKSSTHFSVTPRCQIA